MIGTARMDRDGVRKLLARARKEGFAVPAFNYSDVWDFLAIVEAAEELSAPIFVSSHQLVVEAIGVEMCAAIGGAAMRKARAPLHPSPRSLEEHRRVPALLLTTGTRPS